MVQIKLSAYNASIEDPAVKTLIEALDSYDTELWDMNKKIHSNPELGYAEFKAHDNNAALLESLGFSITRHAYGIETSFIAEYGSGGRVVAFNAEYDALPNIGHACGHNLIAAISIASVLGLAKAIKEHKIPGRVRLIASPVRCDYNSPGVPGSTDQGNVTYECPGFQGYVGIPAESGAYNHTSGFTAAAGTENAHKLSMATAKGQEIVGWKILTDEEVASSVKTDFEADKKSRHLPIIRETPSGGCC